VELAERVALIPILRSGLGMVRPRRPPPRIQLCVSVMMVVGGGGLLGSTSQLGCGVAGLRFNLGCEPWWRLFFVASSGACPLAAVSFVPACLPFGLTPPMAGLRPVVSQVDAMQELLPTARVRPLACLLACLAPSRLSSNVVVCGSSCPSPCRSPPSVPQVHHIGIYGSSEMQSCILYYNRLPAEADCDVAVVLDPLIASGEGAQRLQAQNSGCLAPRAAHAHLVSSVHVSCV
jgi:hypothetical protein